MRSRPWPEGPSGSDRRGFLPRPEERPQEFLVVRLGVWLASSPTPTLPSSHDGADSCQLPRRSTGMNFFLFPLANA